MSKATGKHFSVGSRSSAAASLRRSGYKVPGFPALLGTDFSQMSCAEKIELLHAILRHQIHGMSFSPYLEGQSPGTEISEHQIRQRLNIIQPYTQWIRSFSCREGNQETPRIAYENGLKTMVGVVLSEELDTNEIELRNGIEVARAGHADILAVGNEVMLREHAGCINQIVETYMLGVLLK